MKTELEFEFAIEASESPVVAVSQRLAVAHGQTTQEFARELRAQHLALLGKVTALAPLGTMLPVGPVVRLESAGGAKWTFAITKLQAHGQVGAMLIAVLTEEESFIADVVKRVRGDLARRTGRFLQ